MTITEIKDAIEQNISESLSKCGLMFRIFGRVKTERSLKHKMDIKGEKYRRGDAKIQDVIGLRIVLYFPDDVELMEFFLSNKNLVDSAVDTPDVYTFRPRRLNLTKNIPEELIEDFRKGLPGEYEPYIDNTYEVQIRTIFSEGWHEVEHDLRYKCSEDWNGYDSFGRALNGLIATLETTEWGMNSIFKGMAQQNFNNSNFRAMLRNKMLIRFANDDFSPAVAEYLDNNNDVARGLYESDRMIVLITLLGHTNRLPLTFDNITFLINRIDIMNDGLRALESEETRKTIDDFILS